MTSGISNGTLIALYDGTTKVANLLTNDLDITMATRDTTNKDTSGWKTAAGGLLSWSCSAEAHFDEAASYGFSHLYARIVAATAFTVMVSSQVTGDKKYTGSALLTNLKRTHPNQESATFSVTLEGTGALTEATI